MGFLGFIKDVASLPLDIGKDVITLGGAIIEEESAVIKRAKSMSKNLDETYD